VQLEAYDEAL
jgi:hypothetical protein